MQMWKPNDMKIPHNDVIMVFYSPLRKTLTRQPIGLKLCRLIAYLMLYKIGKFGSHVRLSDITMTS